MTPRAREQRFVVTGDDAGRRLDQVLAAHVPELSRRKARVLIDIGGVFVDGTRVKVAGRVMRPGQEIVAHLGGALERADGRVGREARTRDAARLPAFEVLFEDDDLLVVDKPAGMLTAPTPESDQLNLLSALTLRAREADPRARVYVVHRLDLQTSGVLVFAKTTGANRGLGELFRRHDVERAYLAVLAGALPDGTREVRAPVANRDALTRITTVERIGVVATVVRCELHTGRTHQIRLHAASLGHPVLGDPDVRTRIEPRPPRMALHATVLGFVHPAKGTLERFERPWPDDLEAWIHALREAEAAPAPDEGGGRAS